MPPPLPPRHRAVQQLLNDLAVKMPVVNDCYENVNMVQTGTHGVYLEVHD
jgi:hypothetical protein